ncbi:protein IL-40 [Equus quagga]|uniref:protein IL-40 n=1 Tax=Equus quagga TaxID=89248 RepID=UPI001EE33F55|nr:protein IL-40 [Equus quagga]
MGGSRLPSCFSDRGPAHQFSCSQRAPHWQNHEAPSAPLLGCSRVASSFSVDPEGDPVAQLQAIFTLLDRGSGPRVEISCGAALGSPPITYSLLRKDGLLYTKESHNDGRPANFSLSLNQTSSWFRCQAENDHGVQFSPLRLLPPGCDQKMQALQSPPRTAMVLAPYRRALFE